MVLVTGATGTNGMELIKLLARQGIRVRALVRSPERARAISDLPAVELMVGDLKDPTSIEIAQFCRYHTGGDESGIAQCWCPPLASRRFTRGLRALSAR
jgi:nucleoside-diphosphate-sugar epimerase